MIEGGREFMLKVKKQTKDSISNLWIFPQPVDLAPGCIIHINVFHR